MSSPAPTPSQAPIAVPIIPTTPTTTPINNNTNNNNTNNNQAAAATSLLAFAGGVATATTAYLLPKLWNKIAAKKMSAASSSSSSTPSSASLEFKLPFTPLSNDDPRPANRILLFDVDGTLTVPRHTITPEMLAFMREARKHIKLGVVGGSDLNKQYEQLGPDVLKEFDYVFPENGLVAFKYGQDQIGSTNLKHQFNDEQLKKLINFILHYIADLDIPVKRGTFIEFRTGMLNVSPIGRNCSKDERKAFEKLDHQHKYRETMISELKQRFSDYNLQFSIGGEISFDVFPQGWDKTYCIRYLEKDGINDIHFFGDKTAKGGNDHEIFIDKRVQGHTVVSPDDTKKQVSELLGLKL